MMEGKKMAMVSVKASRFSQHRTTDCCRQPWAKPAPIFLVFIIWVAGREWKIPTRAREAQREIAYR
jgi:hypothetical protein